MLHYAFASSVQGARGWLFSRGGVPTRRQANTPYADTPTRRHADTPTPFPLYRALTLVTVRLVT
jgi:hypothetical protein